MQAYMDKLPSVIESSTLQSFHQFVLTIAEEITLDRYGRNRCKQSQMVTQVRNIVHSRFHEESLTLQTVAQEIFMNPDYVSKMFKKETGEKFTNYVTKFRIQKALEYIDQNSHFTIGTLAEKMGFGDNVSYFSKVFKKTTGLSPSEFK